MKAPLPEAIQETIAEEAIDWMVTGSGAAS